MNKPYVVLIDGKLWDRKVTRNGALKVVQFLRDKGLKAVLAYELTTGSREIIMENN